MFVMPLHYTLNINMPSSACLPSQESPDRYFGPMLTTLNPSEGLHDMEAQPGMDAAVQVTWATVE